MAKNEGHRSWQVIRAIERRPGTSLRLLPREQRVIRERDHGRTLAAIGAELDISAERVRQIGAPSASEAGGGPFIGALAATPVTRPAAMTPFDGGHEPGQKETQLRVRELAQ